MQKEDARKQSREVLHERRKQVIRMHRKGVGVMQIVEQTGLSWTAVNTALRLRSTGSASQSLSGILCLRRRRAYPCSRSLVGNAGPPRPQARYPHLRATGWLSPDSF